MRKGSFLLFYSNTTLNVFYAVDFLIVFRFHFQKESCYRIMVQILCALPYCSTLCVYACVRVCVCVCVCVCVYVKEYWGLDPDPCGQAL
jgi:hypothetical protein